METETLEFCARCGIEEFENSLCEHDGQMICEECLESVTQAEYWEETIRTAVRDLPPLYSTSEVPLDQKTATIRFTVQGCSWEWYPTEFDGEDTLFGFVVGFEEEWGYFSISEWAKMGRGLQWENLDHKNILEEAHRAR